MGWSSKGRSIQVENNRLKKGFLEYWFANKLADIAVFAALVFIISLFSINTPTIAATAPPTEQTLEFDHLSTGYALDGQHQFLECGQCHIKGVFKGTPIVCDGCHDGVVAKGKSSTHVPTEEQCDLCHTTATILETNAVMDHSTISASCLSCHDGIASIGKSSRHVDTSNLCDACHSTVTFVPASFVDHTQVNGSCQGCHNGLIATGKSANHQPTTDLCDACHTTIGWAPALIPIDHAQTLGVCGGCHDGQIALGKSAAHIETTNVCEACHRNTVSFVPAIVTYPTEHEQIINGFASDGCSRSGCHDGLTGFSGRSPSHLPTTDNCGACHTSANFLVVAASAVDHNEVIGSCYSCHDGTTVPGKTEAHPLNMTELCDACHQPGPVSWTPIAASAVDHNEVIGICIVCHDGTIAAGKSGKHVAAPNFQTSDACDACHTTGSAWAPVIAANVDHFEFQVSGCNICHDDGGVTTLLANTKAAFPAHIATTSECDICHSPRAWLPANFNHADVVNLSDCGTACHIPGNPGLPKSATHIASSNVCGACHATNTFKPVLRVDHDEITSSCLSCHFPGSTFSSFSKENIPNHISSSDLCETCHSTLAFRPVITIDHSQLVGGGAGACASCHNGTIATGVNANHIPVTQECDTCHTPNATGWTPTSFDHANNTATACSTCHNGVNATGKPANHIPIIAETCDGCHRPNVGGWTDILSVDHGLVQGSCASCHNGSITLGKNPRHIASTELCEACHITTAFVPADNVNHDEVLGSCNVCHEGTIATGKPVNHPATTNMCDACHSPGVWKPVVVVDHNEVIGSCARCHDGIIAQAKNVGHIPSSDFCGGCHNTQKFTPARVDHSEVTDNCIACHDGTITIGKNSGHPNTSNLCDACHTNFNAFRPVQIVDHNEVIGTCGVCHDGVIAKGKSSGHFVYSALECDDCHTTIRWTITNTYSHDLAGLEYPTPDHRFGNLNCRTCHTQNTSTIPAALSSCARCHERDYDPGEHENLPVTDLQDCTNSTCHESGIEHRADDGGW